MKNKSVLLWKGNIFSTLAVHKIFSEKEYNILYFICNNDSNQNDLKNIPKNLIQLQADLLDITLSDPLSETIEKHLLKLYTLLNVYPKNTFDNLICPETKLESIDDSCLTELNNLGVKSIFPLCNKDSKEIIKEFIDLGFKAVVTQVNSKVLDKSFAGRIIDHNFVNELPVNIDPCGENGEFHTFVFDGPIFKMPVKFSKKEIVLRDGFYCCDLISTENFEIDEDLASFIKDENIEKIKTLTPLMQKEVVELYAECKKISLHFEIVSARRFFEEAIELYNTYYNFYPNQVGVPGIGSHEKGKAIDIKIGDNLSYSPEYDKVAKIWKNRGHYWGGDDIDEYWHFGFKKR